ncbi:ABC transporter permease [Aureisphaera galaxeae]|uniref:ABC transporter permease n=1 Tax=Aureisphaera galaxeae TaxID=1538023 RepID=UPI002350DBFD|nr:ABC transporter permease [Aureisphaera galaxeae]MDC8002727.1 ABC transporter permease [Aureisphaera galaxeae]
MENIKNLFALKKNGIEKESKSTSSESKEQIRITYFQSGYGASTKASGEPVTFGVGLKNLYNSFEDQCRKQLNEQLRLKQPYKEEQEKCKTELKKRETVIAITEDQLKTISSTIKDRQFEMIDVKQNPERYGIDADKRPKAQFYIGISILLPITIYLFVFYISASYSAFFKNFESDSLTAAIFDSNALGKAISDGWLEAIFVGTIPFVFMGLGYLIHMFQKKKGWKVFMKLAALFILTFLFDVILAYLIEKKIFLFDAIIGQQFTPWNAIQSVNFWGIIFAGFVVYIIWGLVFDFIMKEHENVDKIKAFIRSKKEEIHNLNIHKNDLLSKISIIKQEISSIQGKIAELQAKIDGFIFPVKEYLHYHYQYREGWYQAINAELALPAKEKNELRNKCEEVAKKHLQELNLTEMDFQNLIFT